MILSDEKYQLTITDLGDWALQNCLFPQYTPLGEHFDHYCYHQSLPISLFIVLIIYYQDQRGAIPGSLQQQRTPASMPRLSTTTPPPCCHMQHKNKKEIKVQCITKTKRKSKSMQHKNKKGIKVQFCE